MVLVRDDGPVICTGSLISPRFVLTAAHCAGDGLSVLFGNRSRVEARRIVVREAIRHPRYAGRPFAYDLGLLRLVRPVRVRPVAVASRAEDWDLVRPGGMGTILGWGGTAGYTDVSAMLDFIREHVPDLPERLPPLDFGRPLATR